MRIKKIIEFLENKAPLSYQEDYDNSGLIVGDSNQACTGALICLDSTEEIIDEAISKNCNLVIAHHPVIFRGLKRLTGKNYMERTVIKAIKHDIAIYAIHTNLDNVSEGVNKEISDRIGLNNISILTRKRHILSKISVFTPRDYAEKVREAMCNAGGGMIGDYSDCSFNTEGTGTFKALENANPHVGNINEIHREPETRIDILVDNYKLNSVITAMVDAHPYEEIAHDIMPLDNEHPYVGSGMIGFLEEEISPKDFLIMIKSIFKTSVIRYTSFKGDKIKKVAVCGGAGSFLLSEAKKNGADVFVTSDFKYHEFFDGEGDVMICDIGHFESEQFTIDLIGGWIKEKFPTFAVHFTENSTNPVNYF